MINGKKVLGIIPARGGSKGLPKKNIKELSGKPLIAWTILQGQASAYIDRLFVSTDTQEIKNVSIKYGVDIPFLRPPALAEDSSPTADVLIHAINEFEKIGESYDYIVLLEPTSPLRKKDDIDDAIALFASDEASNSLVSVGEVHMEHPMIVKKINQDGYLVPYIDNVKKIHQRQQADTAYFPYGVLYMANVDTYKREKTFYTDKILPYKIERWQNYEVDDLLDFQIIEKIIEIKKEF